MIEIKNITKRYGDLVAVDDLSVTIRDGLIYGFLGPNGAGKTTALGIITGCLAATSGEVVIGGYNIFTSPLEAKRLIGYLPEQAPLYPDMTVREYLRFIARAKGVAKIDTEVYKTMRRAKIDDVADRLIRNLSKGYRQRVGLAQAILGEPKVIILDEPTVGLDPLQIGEFRALIRELGGRHTVIFSSHILSEVSAVCDRVIIISHGRLVAEGTVDELSRKNAGRSTVTLEVKTARERLLALLKGVRGIQKLDIAQEKKGMCTVIIEHGADADPREELSKILGKAGIAILGMASATADLDDIFRDLTADSDDEEGGGGDDGDL